MKVKNDIIELERIYKEIEAITLEHGFTEEVQNNLCLCMDEVFSNIVNYAYDDNAEHNIDIIFDLNAPTKEIKIIITDDGKPFNPVNAASPDFTIDLFEREIGGLGIFIVTNIMSKVEYSRIESLNRLEMVHNIS